MRGNRPPYHQRETIAYMMNTKSLYRAALWTLIGSVAISAVLGIIALLFAAALSQSIALSGTVVVHEGSTILVVLNALRLLRYK